VRAELTAEIEGLNERLLIMESCKSELEAVQKRSLEIESIAKALRQEKTNLEKEAVNSAMTRAKLENQVSELKPRILNLQQELDNSVAVQTDFVRLSQSLQMELEKIRQSEKEVRRDVYF
jgi:Rab GTPase-binding effector protein 1